MRRFDFDEELWDNYATMMQWLILNYGSSEHWTWTWFGPWRAKPHAQWYIGTHRRRWYSSKQYLCVWMPDDIYMMFLLRWM